MTTPKPTNGRMATYGVLGVSGVTMTWLISMQAGLSEIKGNRWTSSNQVAYMQSQVREHAELSSAIFQLREEVAAMPTEIPPQWFLRKVDELEQRIDRLEQR